MSRRMRSRCRDNARPMANRIWDFCRVKVGWVSRIVGCSARPMSSYCEADVRTPKPAIVFYITPTTFVYRTQALVIQSWIPADMLLKAPANQFACRTPANFLIDTHSSFYRTSNPSKRFLKNPNRFVHRAPTIFFWNHSQCFMEPRTPADVRKRFKPNLP